MSAGGGGSGGGDDVEMVVRVLVAMVMAYDGEDDDVMRVASVVTVVVRWLESGRRWSERPDVTKEVMTSARSVNNVEEEDALR
nr:hypothetical protein [Tanacetum cinerariifolium]